MDFFFGTDVGLHKGRKFQHNESLLPNGFKIDTMLFH